jgi:hypothetical protein
LRSLRAIDEFVRIDLLRMEEGQIDNHINEGIIEKSSACSVRLLRF